MWTMWMQSGRRAFILGLGATAIARDALAQQSVDLLLMVAIDTSESVNIERFELQKRGYIEAFQNPRVLSAIQSGGKQAIAVSMVQWAEIDQQERILPWSRVADVATAAAVADAIAAAPRKLFRGITSISGVIDYAVAEFSRSPFTGPRRVIDISGDGSNNAGRPSDDARDDAVAAGVVINGLPIIDIDRNLDEQYRDHVIGGTRSFMIAIDTLDQFAGAIVRKLIIEIADGATRGEPA